MIACRPEEGDATPRLCQDERYRHLKKHTLYGFCCLDNGHVDFPDFLTLMARTVGNKDRKEEDDVMLEALTLLDKDKTGVISTDLLRHVLTSMGEQLTSEEVEELVKEADKDGTGKIDYKGDEIC